MRKTRLALRLRSRCWLAIAVRDDITTLTSYLSRNVQVGGGASQAPAR